MPRALSPLQFVLVLSGKKQPAKGSRRSDPVLHKEQIWQSASTNDRKRQGKRKMWIYCRLPKVVGGASSVDVTFSLPARCFESRCRCWPDGAPLHFLVMAPPTNPLRPAPFSPFSPPVMNSQPPSETKTTNCTTGETLSHLCYPAPSCSTPIVSPDWWF